MERPVFSYMPLDHIYYEVQGQFDFTLMYFHERFNGLKSQSTNFLHSSRSLKTIQKNNDSQKIKILTSGCKKLRK